MEEKKALQPEELDEVSGGLCALNGEKRRRAAVAKALTGSIAAVAAAELVRPVAAAKGMSQAPDLPTTTLEE